MEAACRFHTASETSGVRRGSCEGVVEDSGDCGAFLDFFVLYLLLCL